MCYSEVPELSVPEEIMLHPVQLIFRIMIFRTVCKVLGRSLFTAGWVDCKLWPDIQRGHRTPDDMISEDPVVAHAQTNISSLQESLYMICPTASSGQNISSLRFPTAVPSVIPTLIGVSDVVKEHDIDHGWAGESLPEIVLHVILVIWGGGGHEASLSPNVA